MVNLSTGMATHESKLAPKTDVLSSQPFSVLCVCASQVCSFQINHATVNLGSYRDRPRGRKRPLPEWRARHGSRLLLLPLLCGGSCAAPRGLCLRSATRAWIASRESLGVDTAGKLCMAGGVHERRDGLRCPVWVFSHVGEVQDAAVRVGCDCTSKWIWFAFWFSSRCRVSRCCRKNQVLCRSSHTRSSGTLNPKP